MIELHVQAAFEYYDQHINRPERFKLLKEHKFSITGSIHSVDWELFGSILTGESGKSGYGSDLGTYEIKSAVERASFEYQYHLHGGQTKLKEDMLVNHIFISYSTHYEDVQVRLLEGATLAPVFQKWEPHLIENYSGTNPRQRFRKSISYGFVAKFGTIIMTIENYRLIFPPSPFIEARSQAMQHTVTSTALGHSATTIRSQARIRHHQNQRAHGSMRDSSIKNIHLRPLIEHSLWR